MRMSHNEKQRLPHTATVTVTLPQRNLAEHSLATKPDMYE